MELSAAHLRYLLAIYETAATQRDICSRTIAERLGVSECHGTKIVKLA